MKLLFFCLYLNYCNKKIMNTELWLSLCKHLNSPFINHFIEMQNLINKL